MKSFKELFEMNDNPDPKDLKRAHVQASRDYMAAKTPDERLFAEKKIKAIMAARKQNKLKESFDDVVQAAKYGLKNKAALAMIAAPIPMSMPAGLTLAAVKAVQDYRRRQKLRQKLNEGWKRALAMGAAATAAGAGTGYAVGGAPWVLPGAVLAAAHYALRDLKTDLKHGRKKRLRYVKQRLNYAR